MLKTSLHSVVLGISLLAATSASAAIIDNASDSYTTDPFSANATTASQGPLTLTNNQAAGGLAQTRTTTITGTGGSVTYETKTCSDNPLIPGTPGGVPCFTFSAESGVTGSMAILWNLGGADLTNGGLDDTLRMALNFADFGSSLDITIQGAAGTATITNFITPGGIPGFPGQNVDFSFSSFSGANVFSSVNTITFNFDYPISATDMEIRLLETVDLEPNQPPVGTPEPATIFGLMTFAGLAGASALKKKQK